VEALMQGTLVHAYFSKSKKIIGPQDRNTLKKNSEKRSARVE
jgi:hypothetical protein